MCVIQQKRGKAKDAEQGFKYFEPKIPNKIKMENINLKKSMALTSNLELRSQTISSLVSFNDFFKKLKARET